MTSEVVAAGIVVGLLFETNTIYSGPFSASVGGVDLSFTTAGVTAGVVYLLLLAIFPEHGVVPERAESAGTVEADALSGRSSHCQRRPAIRRS